MPAVSGYLLEEVGAICQGRSGNAVPGDCARIADEINALFGLRITPREVNGARSVPELSALVQAALSGPASAPPTDDAGRAPLSAAQQRIWFMQQFAGDSVLYNVPTRLELTGPLDENALRAALADMWATHEILRTVYPVASGVPFARVGAATALPPVPVVDLTRAADPTAALDRLAAHQAARPFLIDRDPPVRLLMARLGPDRLTLLGTFHHIAVDWVAVNLLVRDLGERYTAHVRGVPEAPVPPACEYSDVARSEASPQMSAAVDRAVFERSAALADVPPLALPTDLPRPRSSRFKGAAVHGGLYAADVAAVRRLARRVRATPFAVLMAAFVTVLGRAGRQREILIGTPASGRVRAEWQDTVGCFVNVVPVVARLDGSPSGADLVARVSEAAWQALDAQDVPFDRLARALGRRAAPLVNVLFSYQPNPPLVPFEHLAETAPAFFSPPGTAKYDLSLYVIGRGAELRLEVEYDTDVYAPDTAAAVLRAYVDTLRSLVGDPDAPVDRSATSGFESAARRTRERTDGIERPAW
nr:hypothetical protein StreXyl84_00260 [Streptomyces sp. Xyl84]